MWASVYHKSGWVHGKHLETAVAVRFITAYGIITSKQHCQTPESVFYNIKISVILPEQQCKYCNDCQFCNKVLEV